MLPVNYVRHATHAALEALLWSETDDDGNPLDDTFIVYDITGDDLPVFCEQVRVFVRDNARDLESIDPEQCGRDFVLTRNGHGAGFWDRGMGELGDRLTESAHAYGECRLIIGDDDLLYLSA